MNMYILLVKKGFHEAEIPRLQNAAFSRCTVILEVSSLFIGKKHPFFSVFVFIYIYIRVTLYIRDEFRNY